MTGRNAFIEGTEQDWQSRLRNRVLDWDGLYEIGVGEPCACRCFRLRRRADCPRTLCLGKDWLHKMLEPNPGQRMSMLEALEHPWLADEEEVKTPLMIETFNIKNNVMRGAANPTFGDSSFEQSVGNSTPVTPASISAPVNLEDQCSQDLEALRIDTNMSQFRDVEEQPTRNGLSATDSANIGSIVGAFPSVPSDVGIPYPEKPPLVSSEGQQSAIFVGKLGSAWSPTAIANGRPKISPQDTVLPTGSKRKSDPQSVPNVHTSPASSGLSSLSSLSSLSDSEQNVMAVDTAPAKAPSRRAAKRRVAPVRRAATGIAANLRSSRVVDNNKPAKRRKVAANPTPPDISPTTTMGRRTSARQAPRSLFPDEDEQPPVEAEHLQNRRSARAKGARR